MQSTSEVERQKWYYDRKANAISLEPGDFVLAKTNAYGGEESEGLVGGGTIKSGAPSCSRHSILPCEEPLDRMLTGPPPKSTFCYHSDRGVLSPYGCAG